MSQSQQLQSSLKTDVAVETIDDMTSFLMRLGRPGTRVWCRPGDTFAVLGQGRGAGINDPRIAMTTIEVARAAGYLCAASADDTEQLSPAGREAMRRDLMAQPAVSGDRRRQAGQTQARDGGAVGTRAAARLTLVEQLGVRRDVKGKPLLNEIQIGAAMRLAKDFSIGQMQPRVTARWSEAIGVPRRRGVPGGGVELAEAVASAQARARSALAAIGGDEANVVLDVCCFEKGLEAIEAARHWPSRAARIVLGLALDRLAKHYGMDMRPSQGSASPRQWGDADFKPNADAWIKR